MHDTPLKARDISPDLLVTVKGEATLEEAAALMLQMDIGSLLVVDGHDKLVGIITDADFGIGPTHAPGAAGQAEVLGHIVRKDIPVEQIYHAARTRRVRDVMSAPVVTVEEDDSIDTVVGRMFQNRIRHVPVVRHGRPVGMVSSRDLLQLLFAKPAASG